MYNVLIFTGKNDEVYKLENEQFDDLGEAKKFKKESNSEYKKESKHWSISVLADEIREVELYRNNLEQLILL